MREKSSAPALVLLGLVGLLLQLWSQLTAYDRLTNLPLSGAPALLALRALAVAAPVIALILAIPLPGQRGCLPGGLYADLPPAACVVGCLSGGLTAAGGLLQLWQSLPAFLDDRQGLSLAACGVDALLTLAGAAMLWMSLASRRQGRETRHSLAALLPGFAGCFWLVFYYHDHSQDPVVEHYCWLLLCLMAAILAFYFQAGYSFGRVRPVWALTFSLTAGVYAFAALPTGDGVSDVLLLCGIGLWMALHCYLLPRRTIPEEPKPRKKAEPKPEPEADLELDLKLGLKLDWETKEK